MSIVWVEGDDGQPVPLPPAPALILLHFTVPYRHAGHVLIRGGDRRGRAWRLLQAARRLGAVRIGRVWTCERVAEREEVLERIQKTGGRGRYCLVCRAAGTSVEK